MAFKAMLQEEEWPKEGLKIQVEQQREISKIIASKVAKEQARHMASDDWRILAKLTLPKEYQEEYKKIYRRVYPEKLRHYEGLPEQKNTANKVAKRFAYDEIMNKRVGELEKSGTINPQEYKEIYDREYKEEYNRQFFISYDLHLRGGMGEDEIKRVAGKNASKKAKKTAHNITCRKILEKRDKEEEEETEEEFKERVCNEEYQKMYPKLSKKYLEYEEHWDYWKGKLKKMFPRLKKLSGGLDYSMTLDEIKKVIKKKFIIMAERGLIISQEEYRRIKDRYMGCPRIDLDRIWGAEYVKRSIEKEGREDYDVPGYVIVSSDPNSINIKLNVWHPCAPIICRLKEGEAFIDFVKILGTKVGLREHPFLERLGVEDFSDSGNVIKETKTGKKYFVDTEMKSFMYEGKRKGIPVDSFAYYAFEKFQHLNNLTKKEDMNITVDLTEEEEEVSEILSKGNDG